MKYLITESQLEKVIFRYLNIQNFYVTKFNDDYNFWNSYDIENPSFDSKIIISTHKQIYCFIKKDFVETISSFFSLDRGDTMNIIGDWVESKTGFEFKNLLIDTN
jgi:hypothetical protein